MFKEWFNKKVVKTVKNVVEPVKEEIKEKTKNKSSFYSVLLKLGCAIITAFMLLRDNFSAKNAMTNATMQPGTIIINNYVGEKA